jgi:hypothetical protein
MVYNIFSINRVLGIVYWYYSHNCLIIKQSSYSSNEVDLKYILCKYLKGKNLRNVRSVTLFFEIKIGTEQYLTSLWKW